MYRIKEDHEEQMEIKKSRFITYLHRTESEADAKAFLTAIRRLHPDATHHCYAFIIGEHNEIKRSNDDGEPAGTAGVPMLECLDRNHMQDIIAITVRYFGGIKLGAGGLIRAYSKSVSHALSTAQITKKQWMEKYEIRFSYDLIGRIDYYFREHCLEILDKAYDEEVCYTYLCDHDNSADFQELSNGKFLPRFIERTLIEVPVTIKEQ
ncbi:MAG: YigZ family protein [Lachnospiraceae bacterium]|jgi:uncharacterized YigZ family protein|nr:YigZ family protein [Merdibacter sp.]HIY89867.1 YigZ family protein [Candidatus Merdibacter merdipullorum]